MQWSELGLPEGAGGALVAARVAGEWARGETARPVVDPADGSTVASTGWADAATVDRAVTAAAAAQRDWAATDVRERARALRAIAAALRDVAAPLGALICAETGKRIEEAVGEVGFSARYFDWFADALTQVMVSATYETPLRRFLVDRRPVGVVAAVSPWNFPLSIPARKVAPALATGCGVVQKPSELAPLSSLVLALLCEQHLPPGVLGTVLGGVETTTALLDHDRVRAVSFTGSTSVGRLVAGRCATSFKRTVLELGGRAPFVVCEDADVEVAVEALLVAKLRNNGESCLAANNVFVQADRADEVLAALRDALSGLVVGDPRDPATGLGPLITEEAVVRMQHLAAGSTGRVDHFGRMSGPGWLSPATVVEGPEVGDEVWSSEIFGPVFSVRRYREEDAVVDEVARWATGLGGYVVSDDIEHQVALARALDVGIVGINNGAPNTPEVPFGGRGDSGLGYEGGLSGLEAFTSHQTLSMAR